MFIIEIERKDARGERGRNGSRFFLTGQICEMRILIWIFGVTLTTVMVFVVQATEYQLVCDFAAYTGERARTCFMLRVFFRF